MIKTMIRNSMLLSGIARLVTAEDLILYLYGHHPKALQESYTCCVYRGKGVNDFRCLDNDEECK